MKKIPLCIGCAVFGLKMADWTLPAGASKLTVPPDLHWRERFRRWFPRCRASSGVVGLVRSWFPPVLTVGGTFDPETRAGGSTQTELPRQPDGEKFLRRQRDTSLRHGTGGRSCDHPIAVSLHRRVQMLLATEVTALPLPRKSRTPPPPESRSEHGEKRKSDGRAYRTRQS